MATFKLIFINNQFNGVLKVLTKHIFYYIKAKSIYQCIFSLDIFISFSEELGYFALCEATILKVVGLFSRPDGTVQTVAVKAVTPGGDY